MDGAIFRSDLAGERILSKKTRVDELVVAVGLASDLDEAARRVMAGEILCGTRRLQKPGEMIAADSELRAKAIRRFVSRGGEKLAGALDAFGIDPKGLSCLDAGCSTGGFSDCLLKRGARTVYAVDVGYGQFDWNLRNDRRVVLLERTNIRHISKAEVPEAVDLVVGDLSFISLVMVLPCLVAVSSVDARFVLLVKPQFELARDEVENGVVEDPRLHEKAVDRVLRAGTDRGLELVGRVTSSLRGPDGNVEIFVQLRRAQS